MKRLWVVALSIVLVCLFGYYYSTRVNASETGEFDNLASWSPNAAAIRNKLSSVSSSGTASAEDARKVLVGDLLTSSFRGHEPKIAVRVKFDHEGPQHKDIVKLMCPARMEPWNMDWLAVNTWRELKDDFGTSYDMDIYITYIGLSQIKVAELRSIPGQTDKVEIRYKSPDEVRHAMNSNFTTSRPASLRSH